MPAETPRSRLLPAWQVPATTACGRHPSALGRGTVDALIETTRSCDHRVWSLARVLPIALTACGPTSNAIDVAEGSRGSSDSGPTATTSTTGTTTTTDGDAPGPSRGHSSGDDGPGFGFIERPDGGSESFECNLWTQDCPHGEKCMPWANDGGGAWNATRCSTIYDPPDEVGAPCIVEGSGVSGIDSCVLGAMCWAVDHETNEGTCRAFCQGDPSHPICLDPGMQCGGPRDFPLCLPSCCPLEQDCPTGQACYAINHDFACAPDVSGEQGSFGDGCEFINVCDPGLLCLGAAALAECGSAGCCTHFCEVGDPICGELQPGLQCIPWFSRDEAPPGLEHVGVCMLPN